MKMHSLAEPTANPPPTAFERVLVWDAPTRVCHWLMAICFSGAYLTAGADGWQQTHTAFGLTMLALVVFRIFWGFVGTRYARFSNSLGTPVVIRWYFSQLPHGWGRRAIGHSPAGGLFAILMLLLALAVGASGWASQGDTVAAFHEKAAHAMLAFIGLHIASVVFRSWRCGENLPLSMLSGFKLGTASESIPTAWRKLALVLVAATMGLGWLQWRSAMVVAEAPPQPVSELRLSPSKEI